MDFRGALRLSGNFASRSRKDAQSVDRKLILQTKLNFCCSNNLRFWIIQETKKFFRIYKVNRKKLIRRMRYPQKRKNFTYRSEFYWNIFIV
jgi:hypothetical protein